jgi:hypothetical protein
MLMSAKGRPAKVRYLPGSFRVLANGDHVACAVTGLPIPIDQLRYWSVERQEPYSSPEAAMKAEGKA